MICTGQCQTKMADCAGLIQAPTEMCKGLLPKALDKVTNVAMLFGVEMPEIDADMLCEMLTEALSDGGDDSDDDDDASDDEDPDDSSTTISPIYPDISDNPAGDDTTMSPSDDDTTTYPDDDSDDPDMDDPGFASGSSTASTS